MIISHKRRFIFVHIPKTGGTSLQAALETRAAADDILLGDTAKARKRRKRAARLSTSARLWKHSRLRDIEDIVDPRDFFVVTLVRNPWDRVVSYYHWLREQRFDHPAVRLSQRVDFNAFLHHPQTIASLQNSTYRAYVTLRDRTVHCNLFARLEHLDELDPLWSHLGFRLDLPHLNRSPRDGDWRGYFSPESYDLVARIYADDIAAFGYD